MKHLPFRRLLAAALLPVVVAAGCAAAPDPLVAASALPANLNAPIVLAEISADGVMRTQVIDTPGRKGSADDAFRIASVTKTYTAATVLRLVEQDKVALDASIAAYIDPALDRILRNEGYDTGRITVRQLLSHTAGLNDHAQSPHFIAVWQDDPHTHWQRRDHIEKLAEWTEPVNEPGVAFSYSDSGYLLLGDLIERVTGQPLATAVRTQLDFDSLGLEATWWEQAEPSAAPRAHQLFDGEDTYDWDASFDLYGGGGLLATVPDMARFYRALFAGRVFDKSATLATMLSNKSLPADSQYRLGIFETDIDGRAVYWHSGYWGTYVAYDPVTRRTIAGAVYDKRDFPLLKEMIALYFGAEKPQR